MDIDPSQLRVRASVVCWWEERLLLVRAVDPVVGTRYLFLPGGAVEAGEMADAAAVRECLEETGYCVRLVGEPVVLDYGFDWAGKRYPCRTSFFAGELIDPAALPVETVDPILDEAVWVPRGEVTAALGYHETILGAVRRLSGGRV